MKQISVEAQNSTAGEEMKPFIVNGLDGNYTVVKITEEEFARLAKGSIVCGDISDEASKIKVTTIHFQDGGLIYDDENAVNFSEFLNPDYETFLAVAENEKRARILVCCYDLENFDRAIHIHNGIEYLGLHCNQFAK